MKVGIVVYSWTGNTLSVAESLKQKLSETEHSVTLEQVTVVGERQRGSRDFELATRPDIGAYDAVIFGAAVEAFSLSPILKRYLKQIDSLTGKRIGCLVTQAFPYAWLGGNRAIRQMRKLCEGKGGRIYATGIVNWAASRREKTTVEAIDRLSRLQ